MVSSSVHAMQINLLGFRLRTFAPPDEIEALKLSLYSRCIGPPVEKPDLVYSVEFEGDDIRILEGETGGKILYETQDRSDLYWWFEDTLYKGSLRPLSHY